MEELPLLLVEELPLLLLVEELPLLLPLQVSGLFDRGPVIVRESTVE